MIDELVLCIPAARLHVAGAFQGFRPFDPGFLTTILDPAHFVFLPRAAAENDPTHLQLIPYVVLRHGGAVFHYTRGSGGEHRLRAKRSVGVGGHITADDHANGVDAFRAGLHRELTEEVEIASVVREQPFGFIFDDSVPVGRVHLGVVVVLHLERPAVTPREEGMIEAGFAPLARLRGQRDEFETWSRLVLEALPDDGP